MNAKELVSLLGLTSEDEKVKSFLSGCGITKKLKLKSDDETVVLNNEKLGLEITFRDERHLDVQSKEYEEGSLVLSNVRMYDGNETYKRFEGELPFGLRFEMDKKTAFAKVGQKPAKDNKDTKKARWDFKGYCVFVTFDKDYTKIRIVAVQLPLE